MNSRRGDVVILDYPFSDGSGTKVRPALIVQSDHRNGILTNTIVVLITKNLQRVRSDPNQLLIDITTPEGGQSGLRADSAVTCGNLFTVHERHIIKKVGTLPVVLMRMVDACLKLALDLP